MEAWYDINDVFRHRKPKDRWNSWRWKMSVRHARYMRHLDIASGGGRPARVSLVTYAGLQAIYGTDPVPDLIPYPVPMRLKDAARHHIIEGSLYSTFELEDPPRNVEREVFLELVSRLKNDELCEPDFIPL